MDKESNAVLERLNVFEVEMKIKVEMEVEVEDSLAGIFFTIFDSLAGFDHSFQPQQLL